MISIITLTNVLSHKETTLHLSPGVNIIVGPTDTGKSAIVKGLKWVIFNRPLGDGLRSSWGGDTKVELIVDGEFGPYIKRIKTDNSNMYILEGDVKFSALKGEVPEEVAKMLNMSEINVQTQFDPHFLLSKSSGEVAQYFNKVAHLDKIDVGLQNINRWTREVSKKIDYDSAALETARGRLANYLSLDEIEDRVLALEKKEKARERLLLDRSNLISLTRAIGEIQAEIEEMAFLQELEGLVENLLQLYNKRKNVAMAGRLLEGLLKDIKKVDEELAYHTVWIDQYEELFHKELGKGSICPLCGSVIK